MEQDKDLAEETAKHPSSLSPCLQQELCPLPAGTGDGQAGHQPSCRGADAGLLLLKISPGGMLKTRLKNTFPRTSKGFFPLSSVVRARWHLMPWEHGGPAASLPSLLVRTTFSPKATCSLSPPAHSHGIWELDTQGRRSGSFYRALMVRSLKLTELPYPTHLLLPRERSPQKSKLFTCSASHFCYKTKKKKRG